VAKLSYAVNSYEWSNIFFIALARKLYHRSLTAVNATNQTPFRLLCRSGKPGTRPLWRRLGYGI